MFTVYLCWLFKYNVTTLRMRVKFVAHIERQDKLECLRKLRYNVGIRK
jgi:hypothetical protein